MPLTTHTARDGSLLMPLTTHTARDGSLLMPLTAHTARDGSLLVHYPRMAAAVQVAAVFVSDRKISCVLPPSEHAGVASIRLQTATDARPSDAADPASEFRQCEFRLYGPYSLARLKPSGGPLHGGTAVRIQGAGFVQTGELTVCLRMQGVERRVQALLTMAPLTMAPLTMALLTMAPLTMALLTMAPLTMAPLTTAPLTTAPLTMALLTMAPLTMALLRWHSYDGTLTMALLLLHYLLWQAFWHSETEVRFMTPDFSEPGDARVQLSLNGQQYAVGSELTYHYVSSVSCALM